MTESTFSQVVSEVRAATDFPDIACMRLFERAKDEQWHLDRDVGWDAMHLEQLGSPIRRAMAAIYAQIHFGEVVALSVTAHGVSESPQLWVKLLGATQVMDEARHVEFFSRVLAKLGEQPKILPALQTLACELREADSFEEQLLGTHVVLEGFAQAVFQEGARLARGAMSAPRIRLPGSEAAHTLLTYIDSLVGKDESRHIAFGVLLLQQRWQAMDAPSRARLERRGTEWANALCDALDSLGPSLSTLGIRPESLRMRVRRAQAAHLRAIGFRMLGTAYADEQAQLDGLTPEVLP